MIPRLFPRSALHEHADPAVRLQGVAALAPESLELTQILTADPSPEVRIAAAQRCTNAAALATAWTIETDASVRAALAALLAEAFAATTDADGAGAFLVGDACSDAVRADVAQLTVDPERRRVAVGAIRDEAALVQLALSAPLADTRMAAAARVQSAQALADLADAAKNKDHGVARHARQRLDALEEKRGQDAEADAILDELEALATKDGPILSAVIELNRRWQALDLSGDGARLARCEAARSLLHARFDREQEEQRTRARFERRLAEWIDAAAPAASDALAQRRVELDTLREEARSLGDDAALARLDEAERRIAEWEDDHRAQAGAEALVLEAEQLAAGTSIDHAKLPERWGALERSIRTPELTRRFEAALMAIEHRRLAQVHAAQQEANATRQQIHALLHTAEQALAAGQLQPARAAADEIKARKTAAGLLPKPTTQRLSRVVQQLVELERWEAFGQHQARIQLCERAEALAAQTLGASHVAAEVRKLRDEWKMLDHQHAGVPRNLWQRFDHACEKAYAPAARHFAELAAKRKQTQKLREEFIAAAAAQVPQLQVEPRDWRAIERFLRETDAGWRSPELGGLEPRARRALDSRLAAALAPLRDELAAARATAKAGRQQLIEEALALGPKAMDRDAPSQVKALQARWQAQAKATSLPQRDERPLWESFRAACNAVFVARENKRKDDDNRRHEGLHELEAVCAALEQLAGEKDVDEQQLRSRLRELTARWRRPANGADRGAARALESRYRNAQMAIETALTARARSRANAVWRALAAKEQLCDELDRRVASGAATPPDEAVSASSWAALPTLPTAWERKLSLRRDEATRALSQPDAATPYRARIENGAGARRDLLLELEMALGLSSPAESQAQRLALQVKLLRERFQNAGSAAGANAGERFLTWCATPGVADASDRQRCERIVAAIERQR